jgi:hypothetical protein
LAFALVAAPASAWTFTCEISGGRTAHRFDHHGYESTEERNCGYIHG